MTRSTLHWCTGTHMDISITIYSDASTRLSNARKVQLYFYDKFMFFTFKKMHEVQTIALAKNLKKQKLLGPLHVTF